MTIEEAHNLMRDGKISMANRFDRVSGVRQIVIEWIDPNPGIPRAYLLTPHVEEKVPDHMMEFYRENRGGFRRAKISFGQLH